METFVQVNESTPPKFDQKISLANLFIKIMRLSLKTQHIRCAAGEYMHIYLIYYATTRLVASMNI